MVARNDGGDIYVGVHADTTPFDPEFEAGLRKSAKDAEKLLDATGEVWGETLADATTEELGKHGKDFTGAIEEGIKKNKIQIDGEWFTIDRNGKLHNSAGQFARSVGETMVEEVAEAFTRATSSGGGGIFGKIGTGISDAIGAGFNISGRSPLIALLIPAVGAIVTAVFGAIQAVNGLSAALVAVPPLIAAIGLQVATVAIAFDGVGEAMTNAFAATNAKELNEAIKDLTPSAQAFVKSMLPVKKMWEDLKNIVQENFFQGLGNSVAPMLRSLIELTKGPFGVLARQLGEFFAQIAEFFDSKVFSDFVLNVFPATGRWLASFGPVFVDLLRSLTKMATVAIPFLEKLGGLLNKVFIKITNNIDQAIEDGSFEAWLDDMFETLKTLGTVFGNIIGFVKDFMGAVNEAGGNKALQSIGEFFERLAFFFSSPLGIQALEGMINAAIVLTEIFGGLLIVIGLIFAAFQTAAEAIGAFLDWLINTALPWLGGVFEDIGKFFEDLWFKIQMIWGEITGSFAAAIQAIGEFFAGLAHSVNETIGDIIQFFRDLPENMLRALGDLGRILWDAGKKIIKGLWDGMIEKFREVRDWLANLALEITQVKGPLDYDKIMLTPAGEAIMDGLAKGMRNKVPEVLGLAASVTDTLANLADMPGVGINVPKMDAMSLSATQVINMNMGGLTFDGVPSDTQAVSAGKAVAAGAQSQLQQRDTRLAVRMI